ncbi:DUF1326 domain-containing protein [Sorangium cellulosum]|uniref:DUF1326 domain-containing protein n=1 Tax=Sorangium cellulosum TaxID=56 RepID=UPI003D9A416D
MNVQSGGQRVQALLDAVEGQAGAQPDAPPVEAGSRVDWRLRGEWFDICSCSLPCPCTFAQTPTHGDCLFTLVWQIHEGHHADVDLSGLGVVSIGEFKGNMWVGDPNATMKLMFYIDAKADSDQRRALERIGPGQVATWGVVEDDLAVGFDFSHPYKGGSSKHFPFDWRPE